MVVVGQALGYNNMRKLELDSRCAGGGQRYFLVMQVWDISSVWSEFGY
jgi:hypothetical protein